MRSRTEPLATARATRIEHLATARSSHPGPEAMTALAHQLARLIGPLHGLPRYIPRSKSVAFGPDTSSKKPAGAAIHAAVSGRFCCMARL